MSLCIEIQDDTENDRFMFREQEVTETNIFLNIETLCSGKRHIDKSDIPGESAVHFYKSMDVLVQELIGERLLILNKYVSLDPVKKMLCVGETWLKNDGYLLILH